MHDNQTIIIIPARMGSTRLPNKPLAEINGSPMIAHVVKRAQESQQGDVLVACDHIDIKIAAEKAGAQAVLTDPDLPSGSDRIWQALKMQGNKYDVIVNMQGDEPLLDPNYLKRVVDLMAQTPADIGTLVAPVQTKEDIQNPNVVKAVLSAGANDTIARALYFSRQPVPHNAHTYYHHIGLYAYRYEALKKFVSCQPSPLEKQESLEQLRALENGMTLYAAVVDKAPKGVDTLEDLEKTRKILT